MTTVDDQIVQFIQARLDQEWRAAMDVPNQRWEADVVLNVLQIPGGKVGPFQTTAQLIAEMRRMPGAARHAALQDPDHILRGVAAKRLLLTLADAMDQQAQDDAAGVGHRIPQLIGDVRARQIRRILASEWSQHPDYEPDWKL